MDKSQFDVLVIGGGSAGCALAGRLAGETDLRVGLVEAGPDYGSLSAGGWPADLLDARIKPTSHDWGYAEARARVIGGCSAHNQCAAIWPIPADFDEWAKGGNPGWSHADVFPLIDRIERDLSPLSEPQRGRHGIVPTLPYADEELSLWHRATMESALAAGYSRIYDLSAAEPAVGFTPFHANVQDLVRWNSALAFIDPVRSRHNFQIIANTMVDRLIVEHGRAVELIAHSPQGERRIRADRFVLSAGVFGSPAVLLRSGIGPASDLQVLSIPIVRDLSGVGSHLQEHPGVAIQFAPSADFVRALEQERAEGRFFEGQVNGRAATRFCDRGFDLHIISHQSGGRREPWKIELMAFDMVPESTGRVSLASRDPQRAPRIDFGFLSDEGGRDSALLLDSMRLMRELATHDPIARLVQDEATPGREIEGVQLEGYIRQTVHGYGHAGGTCRMGPDSDPSAVVDGQGRVRGIDNLVVADASILPRLPRANTNLLCFLIGWRIAGVLAASQRL